MRDELSTSLFASGFLFLLSVLLVITNVVQLYEIRDSVEPRILNLNLIVTLHLS